MSSLAEQLQNAEALHKVMIPDLWQQEAVAALRAGKDVVVHAPTGAGKTLIFELWSNQGRNRGQAIYTVPTRALANDKLAEWRARGWDVGIATGDLAENLSAPVIVATLETQKNRLIAGDGPSLLVIDEYQMLGDADRGLNYELAMALAPARTQLLLLSGSVENPHHVVEWLNRIGREAVLVRYEHRPVPLEEVWANHLNFHVPSNIKGYWPRLVAKALAEDLGPILIFTPRRQAAEALAGELGRMLPIPNPLSLSAEQKALAGDNLARMLKSRVSYHHSGLSYGARAGVIEPLAKAGQLRVVVATMGLAAGINFSLRSVALAGESYRRDMVEQPLRGDEILQMFGRAGRRGLDETGFVVISANGIRLLDARPAYLSRSASVDWSALLGLMAAAARAELDPFTEAVRVQDRLFSTKPIVLGVEESLKHPHVPCRLKTDSERGRHVRKRVIEILNSRGEWEIQKPLEEKPLKEIFIVTDQPPAGVHLRSILTEPGALEKYGAGTMAVLNEENGEKVYGRSITVADRINENKLIIAKWVRRLTDWKGRQIDPAVWESHLVPLLRRKLEEQGTPLVRFEENPRRVYALISLAEHKIKATIDTYGVGLWKPPFREVLPADCAECSLVPVCRKLPTSTGVALLWRRLGLVDAAGVPTRRGEITSFFTQGDGLALAAALEDETYPLSELVYDIANLDGGFRFARDESRWAGKLATACQKIYGNMSIPGYLENGIPPKYGAGAEQVVAGVHKNPASKHQWVTELLGEGDIDRVIIEWRSMMRQISHSPDIEWERWRELKQAAKAMLNETESPTLAELPPLQYHQTRRVDHRLILRRH